MISFDKEELIKIAKLSGFTLDENEIEVFGNQLTEVINYTTEMDSIKTQVIFDSKANANIFREDKIIECNSEDVLECAPEREDNYFVVPKIL